jgi:hypothetical protein
VADPFGSKTSPKRMEKSPASGEFGPSRPKQVANPPMTDFVSSDSDFAPSDLRKRGGGGKLSRSETVTVRLDPKLRYLAELAARKQRRTLSSFIEWAIEENLKNLCLDDGDEPGRSIASQSAELWDVDEPDRFAKLALNHPGMLTHDEQVLWKLIRENGYLWSGRFDREGGRWIWQVQPSDLIVERLREHWEAFKAVAYEDADKAKLPTWTKKKKRLDDEIPF